jgi:hypothetical protein
MQRAVPLVFLQGPWLRPSCWDAVQRLLEARGWETRRADLFAKNTGARGSATATATTVRGQVAALKEALGTQYPPVVVAHSTSFFVVQKYLESFSVSGLVMLAPVPPDPATDGCLDRFLHADTAMAAAWGAGDDTSATARREFTTLPPFLQSDLSMDETIAAAAAAAVASSSGGGSAPAASVLRPRSHREFLLDIGNYQVKVEPQPVPMHLICGTADHFVTSRCVRLSACMLACASSLLLSLFLPQ